MNNKKSAAQVANADSNGAPLVCGVVMPISAIDGCSEAHWVDVRSILDDAITVAGFEPNLVSDADDAGVIHKRIIQNLHSNPIVVCDVSGRNPNVMFELGMRLAFDKPTIIVKDDVTPYTFDTSAIEHIEYPRDLRFSRIVEFKQKLADKLRSTHSRANSDPSYTTFLKHFGEFKVAKIDTKEVTGQEFVLEELRNIRWALRRLERESVQQTRDTDAKTKVEQDRLWRLSSTVDVCLTGMTPDEINKLQEEVMGMPETASIAYKDGETGGHKHLVIGLRTDSPARKERVRDLVKGLLPEGKGYLAPHL